MFGDKKTLGDVWEISASDKAGPSDEGGDPGSGPAQMKMEKMARQLGIEDLETFTKLVQLIVENC